MMPILASVSSIFVAVLLFMLGNSLLGITLPLKMEAAGFANETTGIIMAAYFVGILAGCVYGKELILRVGHIRAFSGLAALSVGAMLGHAMLFHPVAWTLLRFVTGLCIAGLFSALESWLNDRTDNENRGRVLGVYMVITYLALALGQLMINVWSPDGVGGFVAAALFTSLAIVPVALTRAEAPSLATAGPLTLRELYETSPLAVVAAVLAGLMIGAFWGMGAIFAREIGFDVFEISLFTGSYIAGGLVLQIPIGRMSDRFDRRTVLGHLLAAAVMACVAGLAAARFGDPLGLVLGLAALLGGAISNIYPICMAQAFDYLDRDRYVAGASRLLMAFSAGAIGGPLICSVAMTWFGPHAFFGYLGLVAASLIGFVLYRMARRKPLPLDEQQEFIALPRMSPVGAALDPRSEPADGTAATGATPDQTAAGDREGDGAPPAPP